MVLALLAMWAISGANEAATCEWPTVVAYRAGEKCSGVLVHPQVILTAAHCMQADTAARIRFGERSSPDEFDVEVAECFVNPDFDAEWGPGDIAVCTLVEPVSDIPPTPILAGCEADGFLRGSAAVIVGFGGTNLDPEYGTKRYVFTELATDPLDNGTVNVGDSQASACLGDSGGPALVALPDGSWRVLGIVSGGTSCDGAPATYVLAHPYSAWIEAVTGFDVTACHDPAGRWAPGPGCVGASLFPIDFATTWDARCASPLSSPAPQCVTPDADEPEDSGSGGSTGDSAGAAAPGGGCHACGTRPGFAVWLLAVAVSRRRRRHDDGPSART